MKQIGFILTLILYFSLVFYSKLLDNFVNIIYAMLFGVFLGLILKFFANNRFKKVGWGILYGSITSLSIITLFTIWLTYNYPI